MIWWVMIFCGVVTFFTRFVMFSDMAPKKLPDWSEDVLSFVPVAVLTAIIVPSVLIGGDNALEITDNERLPAAILAGLVAWLTRSVLATIGIGLAALWCMNWLIF